MKKPAAAGAVSRDRNKNTKFQALKAAGEIPEFAIAMIENAPKGKKRETETLVINNGIKLMVDGTYNMAFDERYFEDAHSNRCSNTLKQYTYLNTTLYIIITHLKCGHDHICFVYLRSCTRGEWEWGNVGK